MTIEIKRVKYPAHSENLFSDVHCFRCNDISQENGDFLDRPLELVGFESLATLEKALQEAQRHNAHYPDHKIIVREFDAGKLQELLGNQTGN